MSLFAFTFLTEARKMVHEKEGHLHQIAKTFESEMKGFFSRVSRENVKVCDNLSSLID